MDASPAEAFQHRAVAHPGDAADEREQSRPCSLAVDPCEEGMQRAAANGSTRDRQDRLLEPRAFGEARRRGPRVERDVLRPQPLDREPADRRRVGNPGRIVEEHRIELWLVQGEAPSIEQASRSSACEIAGKRDSRGRARALEEPLDPLEQRFVRVREGAEADGAVHERVWDERRGKADYPAHAPDGAGREQAAHDRRLRALHRGHERPASHLTHDIGVADSWVTFDCYGTLIDWESGVADAIAPLLPRAVDRRALAKRYIEIEASVEGERYLSYREILDRAGTALLREHGVDAPSPLLASLPSWRPFPEVTAALEELRARGHRLAILSNVDRDLLDHSIEALGQRPDLAITAEDCGSYKPAPGHWQRFLRDSGVTSASVVHVGASQYHDMRPAAALGFRTVFVDRHGEELVTAPTRVIPDLSPLRRTIAEIMPAWERA